jgi:hypothetical protein
MSNISRDFSLQLSKCLADSDLVVIGLSGIGPIRKISVLDWFLPYWPNESLYFSCFNGEKQLQTMYGVGVKVRVMVFNGFNTVILCYVQIPSQLFDLRAVCQFNVK